MFSAVRVSTAMLELEITLAKLVSPQISTGAVFCGSGWVGEDTEAQAGEVGNARTQEVLEGEGMANGEEVEGDGRGGGEEGAGHIANTAECRLGIHSPDILSQNRIHVYV